MDEQMRDKLSGEIMNIRCVVPDAMSANLVLAYKLGHRDARHAAAELVTTHAAALSQPAAAKGQSIGGRCQRHLMNEGKPYPRTCAVCGLGPCHYGVQQKTTP